MSENDTEWRGRLRLLLEDFVDEFVINGADMRGPCCGDHGNGGASRVGEARYKSRRRNLQLSGSGTANDWPAAR